MTQLDLELCRLEAALKRVEAQIVDGADRAQQDIKTLTEHHRRSLGQIVRWQQQRVMGVMRA